MKLPVVVPVLLAAACMGCQKQGEDRVVKLPAEIVIAKPISVTQRFLLTNSADLAFDTVTGSLCKTWDWRQEMPEYNTPEYNAKPNARHINDQTLCSRLYEFSQQDEREKAAQMARLAKGQ